MAEIYSKSLISRLWCLTPFPLSRTIPTSVWTAWSYGGACAVGIGKLWEIIVVRPCFTLFVGRVLPFDLACTNAYAELLARVRKAGGGIGTADACIAAVAVANGFAIATRDTSPFRAGGLTIINPWED